jgi:hypothetical protein
MTKPLGQDDLFLENGVRKQQMPPAYMQKKV